MVFQLFRTAEKNFFRPETIISLYCCDLCRVLKKLTLRGGWFVINYSVFSKSII